MKVLRTLVFGLAVCVASGAVRGEAGGEVVDVSSRLAEIVKQYDVPGMAVVVVMGDRVVATGAAGVRRRGSDEKITINDQFHLGSDTKAFTASLCAMFVEEGKLKWDTTVGEVFGDKVKNMGPQWRDVTLRELLTHRGGAPGSIEPELRARLRLIQDDPVEARRQLLLGTVTRPPAAKPGTEFIYSNTGYAIAGHMAETVAGESWEQLMRERIFEPLGMKSAGFGAPGEAGKVDEPWGHTVRGKPVEPGPFADNPPAIGPAGRIHCSLGDWAKFVTWHLNGERDGKGLLKPESFVVMHGAVGEYAMGWAVAQRAWGGGKVLTHAGSNTMWFAVTWLAPQKGFAVLVGCNQGGDQAKKACDVASVAMIRQWLSR
jgi:CubicO group peptidase (beta-lactamase class C family)